MNAFRDTALLQRFRLCRADMVEAIGACRHPPNSSTLRELADLQLIIMAVEQVIADKADPVFMSHFQEQAAA